MMPSWSSEICSSNSDTSMPRLSTPRILPIPSVMFLPGMKAPGGTNTPFMRARIGRPAHDLHGIARAGIDHAHAQAVRVRMLFGRYHPRDGERRQHLAPVRDALDFEPDHGELVDDRRKRRVGVEVLLEPSEGELHHCADSGAIVSPICKGGVAGAASRA